MLFSCTGPVFCEDATPSVVVAPAVMPLDIIFVLDNSGSMKQNDREFLMGKFLQTSASNLPVGSRLAILIFDEMPNLIMNLTSTTDPDFQENLQKTISMIDYQGKLTSSPRAIERAIYELANNAREGVEKIIVFVTDGIVDTGDPQKNLTETEWLRTELVADATRQNLKIYGIAFTEAADYRLIQSLALKTGGKYFRALTASEIQGIFNDIINDNLIPTPTPRLVSQIIQRTLNRDKTHQQGQKFWQKPEILAGAAVIGLVLLVSLILLFRRRASRKFQLQIRSIMDEKNSQSGKEIIGDVPPARIQDLSGVMKPPCFEIKQGVTRIGRLTDLNDIAISKPTVSKEHALIEFKNDRYYIIDLRSANGTSLNGKQFSSPDNITEKPLKSGDKIKIDTFECQFFLKSTRAVAQTILRPVATPRKPLPPKNQRSKSGPQAGNEPRMGTPVEMLNRISSEKVTTEDIPIMMRPSADSHNESDPIKNNIVQPVSTGLVDTRFKATCKNHPNRKAPRICPECSENFCLGCMTEKDGKIMCKNCAGEI